MVMQCESRCLQLATSTYIQLHCTRQLTRQQSATATPPGQARYDNNFPRVALERNEAQMRVRRRDAAAF